MNAPLVSAYAEDPDFRELILEYVQNLPVRVRDMNAALQVGDLSKVAGLAHQTKGAGGMYGFPELSETAGLLESAAEETQSVELLQELLDELNVIIRRIEAGL